MKAREFLTDHKMVFKRNPKTGKISLKWRCETGLRSGRTVPRVSDCSAPPDVAQAQRMKKTRQRTKIRQARRAKRTKRVNPSSKLARWLNAVSRSRKK
jgi:hypothetical protein